MSLKQWLEDTLNIDVCPPTWIKWIIVTAASIPGGIVFANSGSWLYAWQMYLFAMFILWALTKIAEPVGMFCVKALLFLLP